MKTYIIIYKNYINRKLVKHKIKLYNVNDLIDTNKRLLKSNKAYSLENYILYDFYLVKFKRKTKLKIKS